MSDWTHVRVKVETRDRLRVECEALVAAIQAGFTEADENYNPEPINPKCSGLSFNAMLEMLLADRQRHRERRRASK